MMLIGERPAVKDEADQKKATKISIAPARTGVGGVALLPDREPPKEQKYVISTARARRELDSYLPDAKKESIRTLMQLRGAGAPPEMVKRAEAEVAYLHHPKGPAYQTHLLDAAGRKQIEAVITEKQTPLDRIREIGVATGVAVKSLTPADVARATRQLEGAKDQHERAKPGADDRSR